MFVIELNSNQDGEITNNPPNDNNGDLGGHAIITREFWYGKEPKCYKNITRPVDMVIIKHTGGGPCNSFTMCAGKVRTIYGIDLADHGLCDIYCNFLIGGDGSIYVGRGWDVRNAQRDRTIDIVFMGSFDDEILTDTMIEAALLLIQFGANQGKLVQDYIVVNHNQTASQRSPGRNVFESVVKWPHYDSGLYFGERLVR